MKSLILVLAILSTNVYSFEQSSDLEIKRKVVTLENGETKHTIFIDAKKSIIDEVSCVTYIFKKKNQKICSRIDPQMPFNREISDREGKIELLDIIVQFFSGDQLSFGKLRLKDISS